jgi:hypothetical protein
MITTEIIDMHLPHTAMRSPISGADIDKTSETSILGDRASIDKQQMPSSKSSESAPLTSTAGSSKDPSSLPDYLAFLGKQRELTEMDGKQN